MAAPRFPRAVVHIGTEKTGSTSIQADLGANRALLAQHHIIVPRSVSVGKTAWHLTLAAAFCDFRALRDLGRRFRISKPDEQLAFRGEVEAKLREELETVPPTSTIVLSCEHFHSRFASDGSVAKLMQFVGSFAERVDVVVYLTRQDRLAVSKASTSVRGGALAHGEILPDPAAGDPYYDYLGLWNRYHNSPVVESIVVRALRRDGRGVVDVVDDFMDLCGMDPGRIVRLPARNEGLKLNAAALDTLALITRRFGRDASSFATRDVADILADSAAGSGYRSMISEATARRFVSAFADDNDALARLARLDDALFDDDFSAYPAESEVPSPHEHAREVNDLLLEVLGHVGLESAALRRLATVPGFTLAEPDAVEDPDIRSVRATHLRPIRVNDGSTIGPDQFERQLHFDDNWHEVEQWGRWSSAHEASFWFTVRNRDTPRPLSVRLGVKQPRTVDAPVGIAVDVGSIRATSDESTISVPVPAGVSLVKVTLSSPMIVKPSLAWGAGDRRSLGAGVEWLRLYW